MEIAYSALHLCRCLDRRLVHELRVIAAFKLQLNATYAQQMPNILHRNQLMRKANA